MSQHLIEFVLTPQFFSGLMTGAFLKESIKKVGKKMIGRAYGTDEKDE